MLLFPFSSTASGEGADTAKKCLSHEMALVLASVLLGEGWQPQQHLKQVGTPLRSQLCLTSITLTAMEVPALGPFHLLVWSTVVQRTVTPAHTCT